MALSELKYIKLFIITSICVYNNTLKYKSILIYYIYNFYKSLYDMSMLKLDFRLLLDSFSVAIVTNTYFLQIPIPKWLQRESNPQPLSS